MIAHLSDVVRVYGGQRPGRASALRTLTGSL